MFWCISPGSVIRRNSRTVQYAYDMRVTLFSYCKYMYYNVYHMLFYTYYMQRTTHTLLGDVFGVCNDTETLKYIYIQLCIAKSQTFSKKVFSFKMN